MDPPEYYILFPLDFCAEFPYCQTYLLPNFISDAESCHWKHWVSLPIQNFSYSIGCRHICWCFPWQDSLFYQSSGKNLPLSPGSFCSPFQDRLENLSMCWVPSVLQYSSGSYFSLTSSDFPPVLVLVGSDFRLPLLKSNSEVHFLYVPLGLASGLCFQGICLAHGCLEGFKLVN